MKNKIRTDILNEVASLAANHFTEKLDPKLGFHNITHTMIVVNTVELIYDEMETIFKIRL